MPITRSEAQASRFRPRRSFRLSSKMLQQEKSSGQKAQLVGKLQPLLPFPRRKSGRRSCPSEITSRKPGPQRHTDPAPSSSCVPSRAPLQSLQLTHTAAERSGRSGKPCPEAEGNKDEGKPEPYAEEDVLYLYPTCSPIRGLKEDDVQPFKTMRL